MAMNEQPQQRSNAGSSGRGRVLFIVTGPVILLIVLITVGVMWRGSAPKQPVETAAPPRESEVVQSPMLSTETNPPIAAPQVSTNDAQAVQ
jgi:hypothetical protein